MFVAREREHLHWADISSVGLLFHLGRSITESRILVIGTYWPEEVALRRGDGRHPLQPVANELKRYYGDVWVDLGRSEEIEGRGFNEANSTFLCWAIACQVDEANR